MSATGQALVRSVSEARDQKSEADFTLRDSELLISSWSCWDINWSKPLGSSTLGRKWNLFLGRIEFESPSMSQPNHYMNLICKRLGNQVACCKEVKTDLDMFSSHHGSHVHGNSGVPTSFPLSQLLCLCLWRIDIVHIVPENVSNQFVRYLYM